MIRECLILTSVTASVDLGGGVPRSRRRKATPSECEGVVSLLENLAGVSDGSVAVAGRNCSMTCILAAPPEAGRGANELRLGSSRRIVLLGAESGQAGVRFKVRRGRRGKPGSLTLTFNPSRFLTGTDAQPTLIDARTGKPVVCPSTLPWVMNKLLEFPFELLEAINHAISKAKLLEEKAKAERIRIHQMELNAFLSCSDANGLLQVLAIAMRQPVRDGRVVRPLVRHFGLVDKPEPDLDRDRMGYDPSADRLVRRSLADWLVRYLLHDVLRLDVIGKFTRQNLDRLSSSRRQGRGRMAGNASQARPELRKGDRRGDRPQRPDGVRPAANVAKGIWD